MEGSLDTGFWLDAENYQIRISLAGLSSLY